MSHPQRGVQRGSKKLSKFDFEACMNGYTKFMSIHQKPPSIRCAKSLEELHLARWAQTCRYAYHNDLLSPEHISKLDDISFCWEPEKQRFKQSVHKFLQDNFEQQVKWIFRQECKEGYFLKKRLNKIYDKFSTEAFEALSIKVFQIKFLHEM